MTPHATAHLSEETLDDILLDLAAPEALAHTAACPHCAARLESARASLLGSVAPFNQATLAWSEARSNTLSRDLSTHQPRPTLTLPALASYAAAAIVAASVMLTAGLHHRALTREAAGQPTLTSPAISAEEIANDNAMLHAIDSELYRPVSISAALAEDPQAHLRRHAQQSTN